MGNVSTFCSVLYEPKTAPQISLTTTTAKVSNKKDTTEGLESAIQHTFLAAVPVQALMPREWGSVSPEQSHSWGR